MFFKTRAKRMILNELSALGHCPGNQRVQRYAEAFSNQLDLYIDKYDEQALLTAASIILRTTNLTFLGFFVIYKWEGSDVSSVELIENK